jgi:hypothetical protein
VFHRQHERTEIGACRLSPSSDARSTSCQVAEQEQVAFKRSKVALTEDNLVARMAAVTPLHEEKL